LERKTPGWGYENEGNAAHDWGGRWRDLRMGVGSKGEMKIRRQSLTKIIGGRFGALKLRKRYRAYHERRRCESENPYRKGWGGKWALRLGELYQGEGSLGEKKYKGTRFPGQQSADLCRQENKGISWENAAGRETPRGPGKRVEGKTMGKIFLLGENRVHRKSIVV